MRNLHRLVILVGMFLPSSVLADSGEYIFGSTVRNGGKVVICSQAEPPFRTYQLYDFYELEVYGGRGIEVDFGPEQEDPNAMVLHALERLERVDQARAQKLRRWFESFSSEMTLITTGLPRIDDDEPFFNPRDGCHTIQAVIQDSSPMPDDPRYYVDSEVWSNLHQDPRQVAGLILHELIYREGIEVDVPNSRGVRYLTGLYSSNKILEITEEQYTWILANGDFKTAHLGKVWIDLTKPQLYDDQGRLRQAYVIPGSLIRSRFGEFRVKCQVLFYGDQNLVGFSLDDSESVPVQIAGQEVSLTSHPDVTCDDDSNMFGQYIDGPDALIYTRNFLRVETNLGSFYVSGRIEVFDHEIHKGQVPLGQRDTIDINGSACELSSEVAIRSGSLIATKIKTCRVSPSVNPQRGTLILEGLVRFYADGSLKEARIPLEGMGSTQTAYLNNPEDGLFRITTIASSGNPNAIWDLSFHQNGELKSFILGVTDSFMDRNGVWHRPLEGFGVELDQEGYYVESWPN